MKIIQGRKNRNKYYYDEENMTVSDKVGNCIKLFEPLEGISENNLRIYLDDLFSHFYEISNDFKILCKVDKDLKIEWGRSK